MKVKELIEMLQKQDPESIVVYSDDSNCNWRECSEVKNVKMYHFPGGLMDNRKLDIPGEIEEDATRII